MTGYNFHLRRARTLASAALLAFSLAPATAFACACGCGIFEVGTSSLFPNDEGGMVYFSYAFLDQRKNWSGTSSAPAAANDDKEVRTHFMAMGGQYMFNREWGVMAEVPMWTRHFETAESGTLESFDHTAFGDVRIQAVYTGFSEDMSTGVTFGLKLPTGDDNYANFDRDTQIGTGSTDLLLGIHHSGRLDDEGKWAWFGQATWDQPLASQGGYRPGMEINATAGAYYDSIPLGATMGLSPMFQVIYSHRDHDSGVNSAPGDSGYDRVLIAPGVELDGGDWRVYADVEVPVYQDVRGNQLIGPEQFKLVLSHSI